MRKSTCLVLAALIAVPAAAHDFWLQPARFIVEPGAALPATLQVGHGKFRQRSPIPAGRIVAMQSVGPGGVVDQRSGLNVGKPGDDMRLRFGRSGTYVVALQTNRTPTTLPALRFNDYLNAEGLTPAIAHRARTGASDNPGREVYSRRAKALVQVGAVTSGQAAVTRPVGMTLEIVPEKNPYAMKPAEPLPVRVLFEGRPLAGALVKLTDLGADEKPVAMHRTDGAGRAVFSVPYGGAWLLNVIWTKPLPNNSAADYDTTFSSLSFAFPGRDR